MHSIVKNNWDLGWYLGKPLLMISVTMKIGGTYSKGQLISKANSKLLIWTKEPTKIFCISALASFVSTTFKDFLKPGEKYKNIFVGSLVQMKSLEFAFEINRPLAKIRIFFFWLIQNFLCFPLSTLRHKLYLFNLYWMFDH